MEHTNGKRRAEIATINPELFEKVKVAHDLMDRLYRIVDLDTAVLMVLTEATPEGLAALEQFIARCEKKIMVLDAIEAVTA